MNLSQQLSLTAKTHPTKTAFIFDDKETSYLELEGAVTKFASQLARLGYKKGGQIAFVFGNSPYFVIGLYGAFRLVAVVIPINPVCTSHEVAYIFNKGDVKGVITLDMLMDKFIAPDSDLPEVPHYITCETGAEITKNRLTPSMKSFTKLIERGTMD